MTFSDGKTFQKLPFAGNFGEDFLIVRVLDIKMDSRQHFWAALGLAGLVEIDDKRKMTWYGEPDGLPSSVISLHIEPPDQLFIGTGEGLYKRNGNGFTLQRTGAFARPLIKRIYSPGSNFLYLGTRSHGVLEFNKKNGAWKRYRVTGESTSNNVYSLLKDYSGQMLVGTATGLFRVDERSGTLKQFGKNGFEINRPIYFISQDPHRQYWFGTDNGIVRWNGTRTRHYGILQGLSGLDSNRGTGIFDSKGRMWVGTDRGLSVYDEKFDHSLEWNPKPKLRLLHLSTDKQRIHFRLSQQSDPGRPSITLDAQTGSMVFHYQGISFQDENALNFSYKLEGFNTGWVKESRSYNQKVRYSNLSPGKYRFHIKARNVMGTWSDIVTSPEIIIPTPFYKMWWFYLLLALIAILVLYLHLRYFTNQRYAALLEKQVEERTSQLQTVERRYANLFEESGDAVFIAAPDRI
ncbi:MAG: hypothetical protein GY940_43750, partial [bacterium]|nr:hypothetical protein [bacterium]